MKKLDRRYKYFRVFLLFFFETECRGTCTPDNPEGQIHADVPQTSQLSHPGGQGGPVCHPVWPQAAGEGVSMRPRYPAYHRWWVMVYCIILDGPNSQRSVLKLHGGSWVIISPDFDLVNEPCKNQKEHTVKPRPEAAYGHDPFWSVFEELVHLDVHKIAPLHKTMVTLQLMIWLWRIYGNYHSISWLWMARGAVLHMDMLP